MTKFLTLLVSLWCVLRLAAQPVSVRIAAIESNIDAADAFIYNNKDSALFFAKTALQQAQDLDTARLILNAHHTLGGVFEAHKDWENARKYYEKNLPIAEKSEKSSWLFMAYTDWAILHKKMGQYAVAEDYHWRVIARGELKKKWELVEAGYNGLGTLYGMMSEFNKAIGFYHKSIEAAQKWDNKAGIIVSEQNISNLYIQAENYEMGLKNIQKTHKMAVELRDSVHIAKALSMMGNVFIAQKKYLDALSKHTEARQIFVKLNEKVPLTEVYVSLADIHLNLGHYVQAQSFMDSCAAIITFMPNYGLADFYRAQGKIHRAVGKNEAAITAFQRSLVLTDSFGFKEIAKDNHAQLADIYAQTNSFQQAYTHSLAAEKLSTELYEARNQKNLTEAHFKFDTEKRDILISTQKKEIEATRLAGIYALIGCLVLCVLLFFTRQQVLEKKKANERIALMMRELHHRVKNNMQTIASMMRVQARQQKDPSVADVLLENKTRLETYAMLHQELYLGDETATINLKPYLENIISKMQHLYLMNSEEQLKINLNIEEKTLPVETALGVGLIFNELITNSLKHATPSVPPLIIDIKLDKTQFHYSDNGQALSADFDLEAQEGFGLQLIQYFAQQLRAKYQFGVQNGLRFDMQF
jgi:two-component system, sensor histidine kinase PdtaS